MSPISFVVGAHVVGDSLMIRYTVHNGGPVDIYLLNRLHRSNPPEISPDLAYVELDTEHRCIVVSKRLASIPTTGASGPTVPVAPYVTPVRAGESYEETFHLTLPVHAYREYGLSPNAARLERYRSLRLIVAYYERAPGMTESQDIAYGEPVVVPGNFPSYPRFLELSDEVSDLDVEVAEP